MPGGAFLGAGAPFLLTGAPFLDEQHPNKDAKNPFFSVYYLNYQLFTFTSESVSYTS